MNREKYINFLERQDDKYIWRLTKQDACHERVINATKLFKEWKELADDSEQRTLEQYFRDTCPTYETSSRHRILITAQFMGFLTKSHNKYDHEDVTEVYTKIANATNEEEYSIVLSEQILKIRIPAITNTRGIQPIYSRNIFPVIFIYQVLRGLRDKNTKELSLNDLYTFVMTRNNHNEVNETIEIILGDSDTEINNKLLSGYKGNSRILKIIKNINLFNITKSTISINDSYLDSMDSFLKNNINNFISDGKLKDNAKYKKFLYSYQGFELPLKNYIKNKSILINQEWQDDQEYNVEVNNCNITKDAREKAKTSHKSEPQYQDRTSREVKKKPLIGKIVMAEHEYKCLYDINHETFTANSTKQSYVEVHHLIPMNKHAYYWDNKKINIDCLENVVPLCPTCHRAIHFGTRQVKTRIIQSLFDKQEEKLKAIAITLTVNMLLEYYLN